MIGWVYSDGSVGYEYEVGDQVKILKVIYDEPFFNRAVGKIGPISRVYHPDKHHITMLDVKDSPDWGPSAVYPWMVEPTAETLANGRYYLA